MTASFKKSLIGRIEDLRKKALRLLKNSTIGPSINIGSTVVFLGPNHPWRELSQDMKRLQTEIYNDYQHMTEVEKTILVIALPEVRKKFDQESKRISEMIEQSHMTWHETVEEAVSSFNKSLDNQIKAINSVHGRIGKGILLIPDTNVFIANPNLHDYKTDKKCSIIVLPTILGELDRLKVEHSNENVRRKAATAIRNFKEYRRRGRLLEGVKITDKITAFTVAVEPKFEEKPSWLDPDNKDDRFIASCFEVASKHPDSDVAILTLDINMQNKADFSMFPFLDPEEEGFF